MNNLPLYFLGCWLIVLTVGCGTPSPTEDAKAWEHPRAAPAGDKARSTSQSLADVTQEYEQEVLQFQQKRQTASTAGQQEVNSKQIPAASPDPETYAYRLIDIIQDNRGDLANLDGIQWILKKVDDGPTRRTAIELIQTDYIETEPIADVLPILVDGYPDQISMQIIKRLAETSNHTRVRAVAKMSHIKGDQAIIRFVHFLDNPKWTDRMKSFVDDSTLKFYREAAEQTFNLEEKLQELDPASIYGGYHYGSKIKGRPVQKIGQMASDMLFSLQHLQVGKSAPNIEAEDLDGIIFSLEEYRGKIVMLDFWGDW